MLDLLGKNITGIAIIVQSLIGLLTAFGLGLTAEQTAAIMTFTTAVLTWIAHRAEPPTPRPPVLPVALVLLLGLASCTAAQLSRFEHARSVARDVLEIARVLCIRANADAVGISAEQVRDAVCDTREQLEPFLQPALGAIRSGAVGAGLVRE